MVSLSKIKKLFFIILVLSFLTGNDCYCMEKKKSENTNNATKSKKLTSAKKTEE